MILDHKCEMTVSTSGKVARCPFCGRTEEVKETPLDKFRAARAENLEKLLKADGWATEARAEVLRAVNSHAALLNAALKAQERLEQLQGHIDPDLERAIAQAEGGI